MRFERQAFVLAIFVLILMAPHVSFSLEPSSPQGDLKLIVEDAKRRAGEMAKSLMDERREGGYNTPHTPGDRGRKVKSIPSTQPGMVFLFVSSSVPLSTLRHYVDASSRISGNVVFVLRGFVGGGKKVRPTLDFVRSFLPLEEGSPVPAEVVVDPLLFRKYRIEMVPAVVFDPSLRMEEIHSPAGEGDFYVVYGDASLGYALEVINREAKSPYLDSLLNQLTSGGYFGK